MRFFFYGTLMDDAVRQAVIGPAAARLAIEPATLAGWRRCKLRGRTYPTIVPAAGAIVAGLLADGVDRLAVQRLDRFETGEYRRMRVSLRDSAGARVWAWVYAAAAAGLAGGACWDFAVWQAFHRAALLRWLAAGPRRPMA